MKKKNVLKNNYDFDRIIKKGRPFKYKDYIIYLERIPSSNYHFGLSVGKKVGNAVIRNRVKRQIRSIIDEKVYQNDFNCIIIVGKGILNRSFLEMKENLYFAFRNLNIMEGEKNEK